MNEVVLLRVRGVTATGLAELWMVYLGATITHSGMSKALATVRDYKMAQAVAVAPMPVEQER